MSPRRRRRRATGGGFTLIEIMVSITLLSVASLSLGTLLFRAARLATATSSASFQTAILSGEAARVDAVPFDLLAAGTTCVDLAAPLPGTRCTTVNNVSARVKTVVIVMTPSGSSLLHPDTTIIRRTTSTASNPLKGS